MLALAAALLSFLLIVGAASAVADSPEPGSYSSPEISQEALAQATDSGDLTAQLTEPEVAESLPHSGLSREEALELIEGVFPLELESPAGVFDDDLEVKRFYSDYVAVIAPGEGPEPQGVVVGEESADQYDGPALLQSTIPLRTTGPDGGEKEVLDLSLEHIGDELQPANPITDVGIPEDLSEGVSLGPSSIGLSLKGAPEGRSPTVVNGSVAFYPNVAEDTDFAVAPTPTGAETFTTIRSAEAPNLIDFSLDLPQGMSVVGTEAGGAEVLDAQGDPEALIRPPSSLDAYGQEIPTAMKVQDDVLHVEVYANASTAYPVLVDPEIEFFLWYEQNTTAGTDWFHPEVTDPELRTGTSWGSGGLWNPGLPLNSPGLYVQAPAGRKLKANTGAVWQLEVPRLKSDEEKYGQPPTTFIASMDLSHLGFYPETGGYNCGFSFCLNFRDDQPEPRYWSGIWDGFNNQWAVAWSHAGNEGPITNFGIHYHYPGNNDHNAKIAEPVGLWNLTDSETSSLVPRTAYVGAAVVEIADSAPPKFGAISSPPWTNGDEGQVPVNFSASDTGLGIWFVVAGDDIHSWPESWHGAAGMSCTGSVPDPCPRTLKGNVGFTPSKLPSGITKMWVMAEDPTLNAGYATFFAKIDRTPPEATLSGPLTASGGKVKPKDYAFSVSAKDGTEAAPQSGIGSVEFKLDGAQVKRVTCEKQNCEMIPEWILHTSAYGVGQHTAEVIVTDRVGRSVKRETKFTIEKDTAAPVITTLAKASGSYPAGTYPVQTNVSDSGSGLAKLELLVDGKRAAAPLTNACADVEEDEEEGHCFTTAASSAQVFAVNMAEYSPGTHALELIATDGAGNVATKQGSMSVESGVGAAHVAPTLALSGTMTEQATLGTTRPRYALKAEAGAGNEFEPSGAAPTYTSAFGSSGSGNGQLVHPADVARDGAGNLWVADAGNNRIEEFNSKGEYLAKFGSQGSGNGQFNRPSAIAINAKGNIVVADSGNVRVEVFNSKGEFVKAFGSAGTGNGQFTSPGPEGIAIDPKGNIWVSDSYGGRLEKFNEAGEFVKAVGTKGSGTGQLGEPVGLDVAADGSVFVADWQNNRVAVFNEAGEFVRHFGAEGTGNGQFKHPGAITVDSRGKLWVADQGNGRVEEFSASGEYLGQFGAKGSGSGQFGYPSAIATDTEGHLWVADAASKEMRSLEPSSNAPIAAYAFDETSGTSAKDSAGSHTATVTAPTWVEGKYGKALSFNGTSSCASVPNGVDLQLSGSFSLEAWVKPANTTQWAPIFFKEAESFYGYSLFFGAFEAGHIQGYVADKPNQWTEVESPEKLVANTWNHVAMTSDGTTLRLYVNGKQIDTGSAKAAMESKGPLLIGCAKNFNEFFNGVIDNARIYGRTLSAAEVETNKGAAITAPAAPSTPIAAYAFDETSGTSAKDSAGSHTATVTAPTWVEGKYGKALSFNGTSSCASVPNGVDLQLSGSFSLEAWVKPANTTQWAPIFFKEAESFYGYSLFFGAFEAGHIQGYVADKPNQWTEVESPEKLVANTWNHVAMTSDGTTLRLYVNGKQIDTGSAKAAMESKGPLLIGCAKNFNEYFNGVIDNARIYGRTLSAAEVETNKGAAVAADGDRIQAWTQPAVNGVASTEITLDGKAVDTSPAGCSTANCTLAREWVFNSASNLGAHSVVVKATSKSGTTMTKTLALEVKADSSKPTLTSSGTLLDAPKGWVEQKKYGLTAAATDPNGSGIKSLVFKVDGVPAESVTKTCPDGACQASLTQPINMGDYQGGAHTAELVATDGVGNVMTKKWTLNVDPKGAIGEGEAAATLEAATETSDVNVVGPSQETDQVDGAGTALELEQGPDGLEGKGTGTPVVISGEDKDEPCTVNMQALLPAESAEAPAFEESEEPDQPAEGSEEEAAENPGVPVSYAPEGEPVDLQQVGTGTGTCSPALINEAAAVESNTNKQVDTVVRPLYDGAMTFTAIRGPGAPESYSWEIDLAEDQELKLIDDHNAAVVYSDGTVAMAIASDPAHDATGAEVPTSLSVTEGKVITLAVHYSSGGPEGQPYVYPILAGAGYQVGTEEVTITYPPDFEDEQEGEWIGADPTTPSIALFELGAPIADASTSADALASPSNVQARHRHFKFTYCWPHHIPGVLGPPGSFDPTFGGEGHARINNQQITLAASECHREDYHGIYWGVTVHGTYHYKVHHWVRVSGDQVGCDHWGEEQPKTDHCKISTNLRAAGPVNVWGEYRFHAGKGSWAWSEGAKATCLLWGGRLYPRTPRSDGGPYERPAIFRPHGITPGLGECSWGTYEEQAEVWG